MKRLTLILLCSTALAAESPPPLPKPPKVYKHATGVEKGAGAKSLLAVEVLPAPKTFTITWCPVDDPTLTFNVYHSYTPGLSGMTLLTNVSSNRFTITVDRSIPMEFFSVKALNVFGIESDWATNKPCD